MILTPDILNDALKDVLSRVSAFRPPKDFDPLKAAAAELLRYGFATEPDRLRMPQQHAFWTRFLSGPLTFSEPDFDFRDHQDSHRVTPRRQTKGAGNRREKSLNWSGAYIKPVRGRTFTEIHGEWTVPKPKPPTDTATGAVPPGSYRSVSFIGLDGQRRYVNSSLPQIGTASHVDVDANGQRTEHTYAWWQWWVRDQHFPETRISSVPVRPGDTVLCSLVVISPTIVRFSLKNQRTRCVFGPIDVHAPVRNRPGAPPVQVKITGATAEWITERPTAFDEKHTLYELPDYGKVPFDHCYAISSSPGAPEQIQGLGLATLIKMRTIKERPHRSVPVSVTELRGQQAFTTTYSKQV